SEAPNAARLDSAQELDLNVGRHFSDFVEEDRAPVRHLERARLFVNRAGKSTFLVSEQLVLEDVLRQCRAVEGEEGTLQPLALGMDGPCDQLLAGSRLAEGSPPGFG